MRPFVNLFLLAGCLLGSLSPAAAVAETPRKIDVKRLSKNIDDVVVPLPNEIFGALNKLDSVNWKEFVRTNKGTNFTERPRSLYSSAPSSPTVSSPCRRRTRRA